ncbi:hypothetical protein AB4144_05840 [Rhizobiaceae sp. 2RAB30]
MGKDPSGRWMISGFVSGSSMTFGYGSRTSRRRNRIAGIRGVGEPPNLSPESQAFIDTCFRLLIIEIEETGIDAAEAAFGLLKVASEHARDTVKDHQDERLLRAD